MDLFDRPDAAPPKAMPAGGPERGPRFGSPEWERCPCGAFATMHFPLAGGLRRCVRCARREGRMHNPGAST